MQRENANDEYGVEMEMEIEYSYKSFKIYHFAWTAAVAVATAAPALPVPMTLVRITIIIALYRAISGFKFLAALSVADFNFNWTEILLWADLTTTLIQSDSIA